MDAGQWDGGVVVSVECVGVGCRSCVRCGCQDGLGYEDRACGRGEGGQATLERTVHERSPLAGPEPVRAGAARTGGERVVRAARSGWLAGCALRVGQVMARARCAGWLSRVGFFQAQGLAVPVVKGGTAVSHSLSCVDGVASLGETNPPRNWRTSSMTPLHPVPRAAPPSRSGPEMACGVKASPWVQLVWLTTAPGMVEPSSSRTTSSMS